MVDVRSHHLNRILIKWIQRKQKRSTKRKTEKKNLRNVFEMLSNWWRRPKMIIIDITGGCDARVKTHLKCAGRPEPAKRNDIRIMNHRFHWKSSRNARANAFGRCSRRIWHLKADIIDTRAHTMWKCISKYFGKKWNHLSAAPLAANRIA